MYLLETTRKSPFSSLNINFFILSSPFEIKKPLVICQWFLSQLHRILDDVIGWIYIVHFAEMIDAILDGIFRVQPAHFGQVDFKECWARDNRAHWSDMSAPRLYYIIEIHFDFHDKFFLLRNTVNFL